MSVRRIRDIPGIHVTPPTGRFLSTADCTALVQQLERLAVGGGDTSVDLESTWMGNLRWARNHVHDSGDVRDNSIRVTRQIRGTTAWVDINQIDASSLSGAVQRAERLLQWHHEHLQNSGPDDYQEPTLAPTIWFDSTYNADATQRAAVLNTVIPPSAAAGMLTAGYLQVSAHGRAVLNSRGLSRYYPFTRAQFSVTVRDPKGTASGWAGVDWNDWTRIDAEKLSAIALDKCLRSRNPVAIEPGRYTSILEPQAVCDLFACVMGNLDREIAELPYGPFGGPKRGRSKIGEKILDSQLTVSADPMDPDLGIPPFDREGGVYHPAVWIDHGILTDLSYNRIFGVEQLGRNTGLPNSGAFRMSGGTTTIDEMIATTKRGVYVTRFSNIEVIDLPSLLCAGYTRDGLWLIENGKISKAIKNFRFTDSPLFAFNLIEQLGVPQRVFHPTAPAVVPPIKVREFSFTALSEAV